MKGIPGFGCAQVLSAFQADHSANWFSGELRFATAMIWDELFFFNNEIKQDLGTR